MNIVYIGTPEISAQVLVKLLQAQAVSGFRISHVITQNDEPVGRKKVLTPSPVKQAALKAGLTVHHSLKLLEQEKFDLALLFAFGKIIPKWALESPTLGFWNIHPSLLPKYRGASPITFPLLLNDTHTGITLMQMDEELDHGPIIEQITIPIGIETTRISLETMLIDNISRLLIKQITSNTIIKKDQKHSEATYTRPLDRKDGFIDIQLLQAALKGSSTMDLRLLPLIYLDWFERNNINKNTLNTTPAKLIWSMLRAFMGWPGVWTTVPISGTEKRLKILSGSLEKNYLELQTVQLEGKNPVDFTVFKRAYGNLL